MQTPAVAAYSCTNEDPAVSFLEWKTQEGRIVEFNCDWRAVRPFDESPRPAEFTERQGAYLAFDEFEIDIGPPSEYQPDRSWPDEFDERCTAAGHPDALQKLRLGGGYPCYGPGRNAGRRPRIYRGAALRRVRAFAAILLSVSL